MQGLQELGNKYKHHLNLASLPDEVWLLVDEFFEKWKSNKLKKQPKGDVKQTHLMHLTGMPHDDQIRLLQEVLCGSTDIRSFQKQRDTRYIDIILLMKRNIYYFCSRYTQKYQVFRWILSL